MALVVEALDGGILDSPVHSFDLTVGPGVPGLGSSVLDVVSGAGVFEGMGAEEFSVGDGLPDERHSRAAGARLGELDAVVGEHGVDSVGDGCDQPQQELSRYGGSGLFMQCDEANLDVRSIATNMWSLPCSVRTSAMSMWK